MARRVTIVARWLEVGGVSSLLVLWLSGDVLSARFDNILGSISRDISCALYDPGTQWMLFLCVGIYFLTFTLLREQLGGWAARGHDGGSRREDRRWRMGVRQRLGNPTVWLAGLLVAAAVAYALHYAEAARSTQALTLLGGAVIGQGVALWEGRRQKAEGKTEIGGTVVGVLIVLLALGAMWQGETGHLFQYRGQARWAGPWDNPNTFGMLMGVGAVLAVGSALREWRMEDGRWKRGEHRTSNIQHSTSNVWAWTKRALLLGAAGVMAVGLVKSYSRGAWVGAVVGLVCLLLYPLITRRHANQNTTGMREGWRGVVARNTIVLVVIVVSVVMTWFWSFREVGGVVVRRAYSVANANDFSWRNRLAAYEGAMQMMSDRPWFGFGWNQPERVYERYYRTAKVEGGMAIQLNDYFTLGMTLGVLALLCFVVYVGLGLTRRPSSVLCAAPGTTDYGPLTTDYWLKMTCRAGAVVLAVGFWFDGGLFKLATGATFWVLLELGRTAKSKV